GVDPVALRIHSKREDFGQVRTLEQDLLPGNQSSQEIELHFVQLKELRIVPAVESRIRQQEFGRTAFDDGAQQVARREVFDCLRGENHGGVALPPRLEAFLDVGAKSRMLDESPGFIHHADLQSRGFSRVLYTSDNSMENIEQQWLEQHGIGAHRLKVEYLETFDCERVLDIVEKAGVPTVADPLMHSPRQCAG